jgi:hypothetical protein
VPLALTSLSHSAISVCVRMEVIRFGLEKQAEGQKVIAYQFEGLAPRMTADKGHMARRMPVLHRHHLDEAAEQPVHYWHHCIDFRHWQGPPGMDRRKPRLGSWHRNVWQRMLRRHSAPRRG